MESIIHYRLRILLIGSLIIGMPSPGKAARCLGKTCYSPSARECTQRQRLLEDGSREPMAQCKLGEIVGAVKEYKKIKEWTWMQTFAVLKNPSNRFWKETKEAVEYGWKKLANCMDDDNHAYVCSVERFIPREDDGCLYSHVTKVCPSCDQMWEGVRSESCLSMNAKSHVSSYIQNPSVANWKTLAVCMNNMNPKYVAIIKEHFASDSWRYMSL